MGVQDCDVPGNAITIVFDKLGTVVLDKPAVDDGTPLGDAQGGDIDISGSVTILGCGTTQHIIDGGRRSRLFEVRRNGSLNIDGMSLQKGSAYVGGAILNRGQLTLTNVSARENVAVGENGGGSCGGAGTGGGGMGAGGVLATTADSTTIMRGEGNECTLFSNTARGGSGGPLRAGACFTGGIGGGPLAGTGGIGDDLGTARVDGGDGGFGSGGGGGGPRLAGKSGRGGHGGWGGGAGGGSYGSPAGLPGRGGFGAGSGTTRTGIFGGRGGGGGAFGGSIVMFGGRVEIEGCIFDGNQALAGSGGQGPQVPSTTPGEDGQAFGHDIFVVDGELSVADLNGITVSYCRDVASDQADCSPMRIPD